MQQAMLRWESTLDATGNTYIQAMLSGSVVNSNTPLQAARETVQDPERKHRCVEAIAAARTYRFPTVPAGSGSLSDEERHNTPGYWEEGPRVAGHNVAYMVGQARRRGNECLGGEARRSWVYCAPMSF